MISQSKNRVQEIKSKFENLNVRKSPLEKAADNESRHELTAYNNKENTIKIKNNDKPLIKDINIKNPVSHELAAANTSYLHGTCDVKRSLSETKKSLSRQISDPGKKLHRSHAFRCDRNQVITKSPKRHGSCNGRSETSDFTLKMADGKLSKDRLKKLGSFLEDQMRKENFVPSFTATKISEDQEICLINSIPDKDVPQHILEQYAKVNKQKKTEEKQDAMTDSGVSSETENLEDDKSSKFKRLMSQFENNDKADEIGAAMKESTNLEAMDDICASSETMKLERKNPHLILTDTLKKALKQPLPPGPPPKKPPRKFTVPIPENEPPKKDPRKMLEKLELVLQKREAQGQVNNIYDIAETDLSLKKPKQMHYLCTEILDITQRSILPNQSVKDPILKCLNSLNCSTINNSMSSLPYTRLNSDSNRNSIKMGCSCSNDSLDQRKARLSTFLEEKKCVKCHRNEGKNDRFKCHLNCNCKMIKSEFFIDDEHIYDEPYLGNETDDVKTIINARKSQYGSINCTKLTPSRSMEELRVTNGDLIYEIPYDVRSRTPEPVHQVTPEPVTTPEAIPITPEVVPATPVIIPATPEVIPATPEVIPATPEVIPATPEVMPAAPETTQSEFAKLRLNFEKGFQKPEPEMGKIDKPIIKLKPILVNSEKKFCTEKKRYRNRCEQVTSFSLPKRNTQLDVDRENLNALMNEIYDTVTAACNMDENKPGSFPTEHSDGNTTEDSVKLTRSLTEKRKNYVRRVSSRVAYLEPASVKTSRFRHQTSICSYKSDVIVNPYSTFRSWKIFRSSQNNLTKDMTRRDSLESKVNLTDSSGNIMSMDYSDDSIDKIAIDEKTGCVDIELPFEPRERGLFNVCLLVGLNYLTGEAYVKSVFPSQVQVPPHIENLVFPETLTGMEKEEWSAEAKSAQCYSLILTDERGERSYGYCRRVLPEGATSCLPLCYCLIGRYRAPGFYYKVLQEIESHHGSSEVEIHNILQQLFETDFPNPGEEITVSYTTVKQDSIPKICDFDYDKSKTLPDMRGRVDALAEYADVTDRREHLPDFYDLENNNTTKKVSVNFQGPRIITIKRPIEPRVDEDNLSVLLDQLGAGLAVKVFGSLLLERKVIVSGDQLSVVSGCLEALQGALYPFVWQQPLIAAIPGALRRDVLGAPLPLLAGMLAADSDAAGLVDEGMLLDLTHPSKVLSYQGDESTILPTSSYKTLKTSLQMESIKNKDRSEDKMRNVMISEAFMRFFVDILGDFWAFFSVGVLKESDMGKGDVVFDKDGFIKNASSKQNQYFLEWFTETAMFNHFIQNMAACFHTRHTSSDDVNLVDTPLPNFYQLFDERVRSRTKGGSAKSSEGKSNYKNAVNKKVRLLKTKLRDLVT